jgi:hypothetical protein
VYKSTQIVLKQLGAIMKKFLAYLALALGLVGSIVISDELREGLHKPYWGAWYKVNVQVGEVAAWRADYGPLLPGRTFNSCRVAVDRLEHGGTVTNYLLEFVSNPKKFPAPEALECKRHFDASPPRNH